MRKINIILALAFTLLIGSVAAAEAFTLHRGFADLSSRHMIDARDSQNRPLESDFTFRSTVFTRVYSEISPFGVTRRVSPPETTESLLPNFILNLPRLMTSFMPGREELMVMLTESVSHPMGAANIVFTAPILGAFMLLLCMKLPTKDEPRFRVPILLE